MRAGGVVACAMSLAGCFSKPTFATPPDGQGSADSPTDGCTTPAQSDDFNGGGTACPFGVAYNLPNSARSSGQMRVSPPAGPEQYSTCTMLSVPFAAGTFVEVSTTLTVTSGITQLVVETAFHTVAFNMQNDDGQYLALVSESTEAKRDTYDPVAMRWWRLRPAGAMIAGDISANGLDWTPFGELSVGSDAIDDVGVTFGAGHYNNEPSPGTAVFDGWNACP